jgi:endonuclease III
VGRKVAECVLAYGWGEEALPLDANVHRVLNRIHENGTRPPTTMSTGELRELLKCNYQKHRNEFAGQCITMVDIHEILRLHGQVCCTRKPDCAACPVSQCGSRLAGMNPTCTKQIVPGLWEDWRELLLEPDSGPMPNNSGLETQLP